MNWIDLKTQRPEMGTPVLICANVYGLDDAEIGIATLEKNGEWWEAQTWTTCSGDWGHYSNDRDVEEKLITHWMPLPNKPVSTSNA